MNNIHICFTCDNNYAPYTGVSIASILKNAGIDDNLTIYIIGYNISEDNKEKINNLKKIKDCNIVFICPEENQFREFTDIKTTDYLPIASFFRLKLASLITDTDKVIYLDPDIIVNTSLSDLYNINIEDYYCGGVPDIGDRRHAKRLKTGKDSFYINSGVLLVNLKKWREDKAESQFINCAKENASDITLGDQDLINRCFAGNILKIDKKWNVQVVNFCSRSDYSRKFNVLHYTGGSKPWKYASYIPLKSHYFKYLALTDWEKPDKKWHFKSTVAGFFAYLIHRPLYILRPGFYKAVLSYILPF